MASFEMLCQMNFCFRRAAVKLGGRMSEAMDEVEDVATKLERNPMDEDDRC